MPTSQAYSEAEMSSCLLSSLLSSLEQCSRHAMNQIANLSNSLQTSKDAFDLTHASSKHIQLALIL